MLRKLSLAIVVLAASCQTKSSDSGGGGSTANCIDRKTSDVCTATRDSNNYTCYWNYSTSTCGSSPNYTSTPGVTNGQYQTSACSQYNYDQTRCQQTAGCTWYGSGSCASNSTISGNGSLSQCTNLDMISCQNSTGSYSPSSSSSYYSNCCWNAQTNRCATLGTSDAYGCTGGGLSPSGFTTSGTYNPGIGSNASIADIIKYGAFLGGLGGLANGGLGGALSGAAQGGLGALSQYIGAANNNFNNNYNNYINSTTSGGVGTSCFGLGQVQCQQMRQMYQRCNWTVNGCVN